MQYHACMYQFEKHLEYIHISLRSEWHTHKWPPSIVALISVGSRGGLTERDIETQKYDMIIFIENSHKSYNMSIMSSHFIKYSS